MECIIGLFIIVFLIYFYISFFDGTNGGNDSTIREREEYNQLLEESYKKSIRKNNKKKEK